MTGAVATEQWTQLLAQRALALEAKFACGGDIQLAAPLQLIGPSGKKLKIAEHEGRPGAIAKTLKSWCAPAAFGEGTQTKTDARVRDGGQLYARDNALTVEGFDDALADIVRDIHRSLCPQATSPPTASLFSLNVYTRGGHFVAHKDTPRDPSVFGTLVVCLPLSFGGGCLVVEQGSRAIFDWGTGTYFASEKNARQIRWAAFYGDVDHHIDTVTSGCRATLTFELRSPPELVSQPHDGDARSDELTASLREALANEAFATEGEAFGLPALHLYSVDQRSVENAVFSGLLKGRDRLFVTAVHRAGLVARVVPYIFETCAGESWRLVREPTAQEKKVFARKRLVASDLEQRLPIELKAEVKRAGWREPFDDVTWLARPPWASRYKLPFDGKAEPGVELLGEPEYSATGYFGNEAAVSTFYAVAAIVFDVLPWRERTLAAARAR